MYHYQFLGTGIYFLEHCKVSILETIPEVINYTCHLSIKVCEYQPLEIDASFSQSAMYNFNFTLLYTIRYFRRMHRKETVVLNVVWRYSVPVKFKHF